eukprot:TRINITY_DN14152_c1_g2_i1.p1 TRINITY_DN14152_c1_g2~~TRINITY_DN14152_c1_g2_i1.p1  ORF type:complete len:301 (+),score=14.69 TRINITY_DN14152_c1_g2_i1:64-966(+)
MACRGDVVVRNTFISIVGDEDVADNSFARQMSDPVPRLPLTHLPSSSSRESPILEDEVEIMRPQVGRSTNKIAENEAHGFEDVHGSGQNTGASSRSLEMKRGRPQPKAFNSRGDPKQRDDDAGKDSNTWKGVTSVMVRNVSYKCTKAMFCDELNRAGFEGLFDYAYVPVNAGRGTSKGYAFANFVDARTAFKFKEQFHGRRMDMPGGTKLLEVIPANLQGYARNVSHYIDKQHEISRAARHVAPQVTRCEAVQSRDTPQGSASNMSSLNASESQTISCCHQCQNYVLSKARFCQWCGGRL